MPNRKKKNLRLLFSANVRREREKLGVSQEALAHICGFHRTYIGAIERGERNISIDNVERLAKGLGVEPWCLLKQRNTRP